MRGTRGYTLIELVVVLLLVGILSTLAIPRFVGRAAFDERGYFEELVAAARYAQKHAIASGCGVQLHITAAGYELRRPATFCDTSAYPAAVSKPMSNDAFAGLAPSGLVVGAVDFAFGADGSATSSGGATVNVGGYAFTVHALSGYVETP